MELTNSAQMNSSNQTTALDSVVVASQLDAIEVERQRVVEGLTEAVSRYLRESQGKEAAVRVLAALVAGQRAVRTVRRATQVRLRLRALLVFFAALDIRQYAKLVSRLSSPMIKTNKKRFKNERENEREN